MLLVRGPNQWGPATKQFAKHADSHLGFSIVVVRRPIAGMSEMILSNALPSEDPVMVSPFLNTGQNPMRTSSFAFLSDPVKTTARI
ncbi:MAG: hypothetical protein UY31_C0005G0003 [Candidatus Wolfebacteria bacterium GW2011_GWE1_48_7]|uniref:Uncharacterized protein n=1 Tax=Candidatus Wolfebacteria bacterium GW2011_GWA2_47_9b TaxID=1619005 RepID=A0A0G1U8A2_9BACT|nr:MAG: hypothetical protein UY19_C0003G0021 [Candidatus Wolfebacteria bacterium GW2011_GWA2_47_9b]KKW00426.1 MAG: hypothetical protein UY31_C0005G0003 [Candidatus Wolfebacteria bacterium GW2011_GWE1_48_7]